MAKRSPRPPLTLRASERVQSAAPRLRRLVRGNSWVAASLGLVAAYAAWMALFRLLALTMLTWFLISSDRRPRFEEISDAFASNELTIVAVGSVLFVLLLRWLSPFASFAPGRIVTAARLEKRFLPGFSSGAKVAAAMTALLLAGGFYRSLGSFLSLDEGTLALGSVLVRAFAIAALAYCEEFLFRWKIQGWLRIHRNSLLSEAAACFTAAMVYCLVKMVQFDIGLMHLMTLFLISIAASIRTLEDNDFGRGAGFVAGILVVFHALLSLPVLGNDFSGALLIKYQAPPQATGELLSILDWDVGRVLTGGAGGPLSSLALQAFLLLDIARGLLRHQKFVLNGQIAQIHLR